MKLFLISEGGGSWGVDFINYLCSLSKIEAVFTSEETHANVIARSAFFGHEPEKINILLPYFTLIGESYAAPLRNYAPIFEIVSILPNAETQIHVPYFLCAFFHMQKVLNLSLDIDNLRVCQTPLSKRPYFLAYCASNASCFERERLFQILKEKDNSKTAHGLGACQTTPGRKLDGPWNTVYLAYSEYRFTIAMENKFKPGYVTEKLLMAMLAGSIPIYWGDSQWVKSVFNEKSIIFVQDYANLDECADYIIKVNETPQLLEQYQNNLPFIKDVSWFSKENPRPEFLKAAEILKDYCKVNQ
jgi:hypothetical protein